MTHFQSALYFVLSSKADRCTYRLSVKQLFCALKKTRLFVRARRLSRGLGSTNGSLNTETVLFGEIFKDRFADIFQTALEQVAFDLRSGPIVNRTLWKRLDPTINRRSPYLQTRKSTSRFAFGDSGARRACSHLFATPCKGDRLSATGSVTKPCSDRARIGNRESTRNVSLRLNVKIGDYLAGGDPIGESLTRSVSVLSDKPSSGQKAALSRAVPSRGSRQSCFKGRFGRAESTRYRDALKNSYPRQIYNRYVVVPSPKPIVPRAPELLSVTKLFCNSERGERRPLTTLSRTLLSLRGSYKALLCTPLTSTSTNRRVLAFTGGDRTYKSLICNPCSYKSLICKKICKGRRSFVKRFVSLRQKASSGFATPIGSREPIERHKRSREPIGIVSIGSGRVITISRTRLVLQKTQPVLFYNTAELDVEKAEWVKAGSALLTLTHQTLITGDIVQGIPRIEQLFEAFTSPPLPLKSKGTDSRFKDSYDTLHSQLRDVFRRHWLQNRLPVAVRKSLEEIESILVETIQKVYLSQGVLIADKHIEIVIRQIASKGQILDSGNTGLLLEEVLNIEQIENANLTTPGKKSLYVPAVMGLTVAALNSDSFVSAASFQETTRVLSRDAVAGKSDFLRGLKEKVVIGDLIAAGTGLDIYFIYTTIVALSKS